jgi:hypothetical protein
LQVQVDAFDHIYNTERPHQGLPGRVTPLTAWEATAKADAPRPTPNPPLLVQAAVRQLQRAPLPAGAHVRTLTTAGTFMLAGVTYKSAAGTDSQVLIATDDDAIIVADLDGEVLIEHTRPTPGVKYVGNGNPAAHTPTDELSPMS